MRFNLTYAAFRVLDRAAGEQLPMCNSTEISAAKLLLALFKEEDCRAGQWLHDAGLSLPQFRHEFDLDILEKATYPQNYWTDNNNNNNVDNIDNDEVDNIDNGNGGVKITRLAMPVSAPSFQVGNYGIPAEAYSATNAVHTNTIKAVAPTNNPNSPTNITTPTNPDSSNSNNKYQQKQNKTKQNSDEITLDENNHTNQSSKRYYSLFAANNSNAPNSINDKIGNQQLNKRTHWFYLDDQPVAIAQLSHEIESAIETISQQFRTPLSKNQKIPLINGSVRSIETTNINYTPNQSIATEHLLLAISMDSSDVGNWLNDHGLDTVTLHERIETLNNSNKIHTNLFDPQFYTPENSPIDEIQLGENSAFDNFIVDKSVSADFISDNIASGHTAFIDFSSSKFDTDQLSYKIYRLLDAAANRGREAVRVLEDYARFVIDDRYLTRCLKDFRHRLQVILSPIDFSKRLAARAAESDIGKEIEAENEYCRNSTQSVIDANFSRLQESLRSIEEFSKINHNEISRQVEQLRYQSYILHKEFSAGNFCNDNCVGVSEGIDCRRVLLDLIADARLYVLVDCMESELVFKETVTQMIEGGVDVIQLRDKLADDRTILNRANILRGLTRSGVIWQDKDSEQRMNNENEANKEREANEKREANEEREVVGESEAKAGRSGCERSMRRVLFVMNDRVDLALLVGADGVHVGQDDLPVKSVRQIIGNEYLVGVSTHNINQACLAEIDGADYIGAGPVFASVTKDFELLAGISFLNELRGEVAIPAFAIGGINEKNIGEIKATGLTRIAVSNAIQNSPNPKQTAENLRNLLTS